MDDSKNWGGGHVPPGSITYEVVADNGTAFTRVNFNSFHKEWYMTHLYCTT